jgi:hypothetical protein
MVKASGRLPMLHRKVQSIQVYIGRSLGIGSKVVDIGADNIERVARFKVHLSESELRSLPEAKQ